MDFLEKAFSIAFKFPSPGFPAFHEIPGMVWVGDFTPNPSLLQILALDFSRDGEFPAPLENWELEPFLSWLSHLDISWDKSQKSSLFPHLFQG